MNPLLTETITITRPASRDTLQHRLAAELQDRECRQRRGHNYGKSLSDQWLEERIATLQEAIKQTPAAGVEASGPMHSCKNCAHRDKSSCEEPCAGCTVRWRSGVSDRWEFAYGVPACEAPDLRALIDRLDGYLNSPEQIALRDDLLAALAALGVPACAPIEPKGGA